MVPEQNYEETDRLEMLLLGQDVLSDFLLDTWKADFKTSSKCRTIPNVDPRSLLSSTTYSIRSGYTMDLVFYPYYYRTSHLR